MHILSFFLIMERKFDSNGKRNFNLPKVKKRSILIVPVVLFLSCGDPPDNGREFLSNLGAYCGYSYQGRTTEFGLGAGDEKHPLEDPLMIMILDECSEDEIRIAFHVDQDQSRTWVLEMRGDQLHLSHDHRYPDGTEYEQNRYGGYSDARGSGLKHFFPADDFTVAERPQRDINVWSMEIDPENDRFFYRLYLEGQLRFEATFYLDDPKPLP